MRGRDGRYSQIASGQIANGDIDGAVRSVGAMKGKPGVSQNMPASARMNLAEIQAMVETPPVP
ncbi:MAG: hypothetical protein ACHRXM_04940 [Isosphaerales bacterium]